MSAGTITVMIIEDDDAIRESLVESLSQDGFAVVTGSDGREALALLEAGVLPDVIVLDLMMPGLNGYDFRKAMMGVRGAAAIPVIVMTAAPQVAMRALLSPFAVLHKPFGLDDLTAAVRDAARLRR